MLHEFVTSNRDEVIARCSANVAKRFAPREVPPAIAHGVPLFLRQLAETLRAEQLTTARVAMEPTALPGSTEIGRSAALHGAELLLRGFTMDQLVHDYGDVCQAITDLAVEQTADISADEFRTLNRCLDNAIADSITAYCEGREVEIDDHAEALRDAQSDFSREQIRLIDIATQSFVAIKTGNIGSAGATGALLVHALDELRVLASRSVPELRRASVRPTTTSS